MAADQLPQGQSPEGLSSILANRMRRLSVSSDTSGSFEFVSLTPSVGSVDSGGVSVCSGATGDGGCAVETEGCADERPQTPTSASVAPSVPVNVEKEHHGKATPPNPPVAPEIDDEEPSIGASDELSQTPPKASPYWYQFVGFVPEPAAAFRDEFNRLVKHRGWGQSAGRKHRTKALLAELVFHFGDLSTAKLDQMQELCKLCRIKDNPLTITQCKLALNSVYINIFDLVDYKRNPRSELRRFKSYKEFNQYTRAGHVFPKGLAKKGGFIKALLNTL